MAKKRVRIPAAVAAKLLFSADRICCVCRVPGKKIQIHHIDDDPSNSNLSNLAVLCLECHGDTQLQGGFGRRLDAEQVRLYRDDWHSLVASTRVQAYRASRVEGETEEGRIRYLTTLTERLRELQDYSTLAFVYDDLGSYDLRDKYIDLALASDDSDWLIIRLRSMQNRRDLIPDEVASRRLHEQEREEDWSQRARTLYALGCYVDAARDYLRSALKDLDQGNTFSAAYYIKELVERDLIDSLFEDALQKATDARELWWQIRCLQELGWTTELRDLLLTNEEAIRTSDQLFLMEQLLRAKGERDEADKLAIEIQAAPEKHMFLSSSSADDGSGLEEERRAGESKD